MTIVSYSYAREFGVFDADTVEGVTAIIMRQGGSMAALGELRRKLGNSQLNVLASAAFDLSLTQHFGDNKTSAMNMVDDIELIDLGRVDECCGFGGTFCVAEEAVSVKMGKDRVADHVLHGVEYITGVDMSCLMHMEGLLHRDKSTLKVIHIAEILNGSTK